MPSPPPPAQPQPLDPVAGLLSYLVPGLGQVVQGRVVKGVLFFVCLYGLFFYGMALGQMKNVWLPDPVRLPPAALPIVGEVKGLPKALYFRTQFLAQFWIGAAAWPAVGQYVLTPTTQFDEDPPARTVFGHYMQAPTEGELNTLQRDGNKLWDLGWVYTVIAGVLNILVIYDAVAGPVVRDDDTPDPKPAADPPAPGGPPA